MSDDQYQSLLKAIVGLGTRVDTGFSGVNERLEKVESRLGKVEDRLLKVEQIVDKGFALLLAPGEVPRLATGSGEPPSEPVPLAAKARG